MGDVVVLTPFVAAGAPLCSEGVGSLRQKPRGNDVTGRGHYLESAGSDWYYQVNWGGQKHQALGQRLDGKLWWWCVATNYGSRNFPR